MQQTPSSDLNHGDNWNPDLDDQKHSFVWRLAEDLIEVLQPKNKMRVLDVGCGTGQLTHQIALRGAQVLGMDSSATMIVQAKQQYPTLDFRKQDAHRFYDEQPFDAVFSNAALHWIRSPRHCLPQQGP